MRSSVARPTCWLHSAGSVPHGRGYAGRVPERASLTPRDAERRRALIRMKAVAAGLLLFAALVWVLCVVLGNGGWVGYVQATAEAAMVGALADWFAVTALFRHPLGLPIPHTAILPRKKDQLGSSLGEFVTRNFLSAEVISERLQTVRPAYRMGVWLADPTHARRRRAVGAGAGANDPIARGTEGAVRRAPGGSGDRGRARPANARGSRRRTAEVSG